jgi:plastocyanin
MSTSGPMPKSPVWVVAIAIAIASCGGDGSASSTAGTATTGTAATITTAADTTTTATSTAQVEVSGLAFHPGDLTIAAGTTVTWVNNDRVAHTATSDDGVWSGDLAAGSSFEFTFDTPGVYPYHCNIHPSMHGTITVTP